MIVRAATGVIAALERIAYRSLPLSALNFECVATNQPDAAAAVTWIDPVNIAGIEREAAGDRHVERAARATTPELH